MKIKKHLHKTEEKELQGDPGDFEDDEDDPVPQQQAESPPVNTSMPSITFSRSPMDGGFTLEVTGENLREAYAVFLELSRRFRLR